MMIDLNRRHLAFMLLISTSIPVVADDIDDARAVGIRILNQLEQGKNAQVWNDDVSDYFKERMTRDAFLANMTIIRAQVGAPSVARNLIQQNRADGNPQYKHKHIYSFLFSTSFPTVKVYESIVLTQEDVGYKLVGLNFVPNPN